MDNIEKIKLISRISRLTSPITSILEKTFIKRISKEEKHLHPLFIIGAPRTGSTVLYQTITNQLDVKYISNLVDLFNDSPYFGFWLSNKLHKDLPHNCFKSNFGNTFNCGLNAPSESGGFWYRYLPKEKHFVDTDEVNQEVVNNIRNEIYSVINKYKKPIVFKNLNAGQRLRLLKEVAPNAKFIFVRRDPLYTAQSIFKARKKLNIDENTWWSVKPRNYQELQNLCIHEQIVKQIYYLEKQIYNDLKLFKKENILIVKYRDLCQSPDQIISEARTLLGNNAKFRENALNNDINFSEKQTISEKDIQLLKNYINELDWSFEND
ncbi:sulfotransferase [Mangrovibacillus sp. Mu-81]|uniref:sulfotransferase family protein n=1 Tax=Mangrovibacillus sp. Mu-81 TaxID=3121478 RepID=UPI002FE49D4C